MNIGMTPPTTGSGVKPPAKEFNPYQAIVTLMEGRERAFEAFCEVNLRMLKAESKLAELRRVVMALNTGKERSEFHRGWCGASDFVLAVLDKEA